jgi:hypothetical protein
MLSARIESRVERRESSGSGWVSDWDTPKKAMRYMGILFFPLLVLPLVLWFGALILRGAITLANKCLSIPPEPIDVPADDEDDWGDYPLPGERATGAATIPKPSVFGAMSMLLAIAVVNVIVGAVVRIVIGTVEGPLDDLAILGRLVTVLIIFLVMAGLLASMLPTTFRRGCLVTLFTYLIALAIAVLVLAPLYVLGLR